MSFKSQLIGFLKRNLILKYRNKSQLFQEIYNPSIILIILVVFNSLFKSEVLPSENYGQNKLMPKGRENIYVFPDDTETRKIFQYIGDNDGIYTMQFFGNLTEMKNSYLKAADNSSDTFWGIEILYKSSSVVNYKIYHRWDDSLIDNNKIKLYGNGKECRLNKTDPLTLSTYYSCSGNKLVYNGFSLLQSSFDYSIKMVNLNFSFS